MLESGKEIEMLFKLKDKIVKGYKRIIAVIENEIYDA